MNKRCLRGPILYREHVVSTSGRSYPSLSWTIRLHALPANQNIPSSDDEAATGASRRLELELSRKQIEDGTSKA